MIYTCYDMIQDCRAGRPQGWSHFISYYVPVIRKLATHYCPEQAGGARIAQVLRALCRPESGLFQCFEAAPERWFVAELRQRVLAAFDEFDSAPPGGLELDLDTLGIALQSFTLLEKQAVWLETMLYTAERAGVLLRMDPRTVEKIREKSAERLRGQMDQWRRSLLVDTARQLGRAAAAAATPECLPDKAFLDVLDGRATWRGREELERHVAGCWHCIDHFCRMAEVVELLRGLTPLPEREAESLRGSLGIAASDTGGWRRWFR